MISIGNKIELMSKKKLRAKSIARPPVYRVLYIQIVVTLMSCIISLIIWDEVNAYSALLGGVISFVPNSIFIWKAFSISGARQAQNIVNAFYKGEAIKITLTAFLFVITFLAVKPLSVITLFIVFILVQAVNWFTPILIKQK